MGGERAIKKGKERDPKQSQHIYKCIPPPYKLINQDSLTTFILKG
jgi:hypothetical protein